ncbi:hypothetical protein ACFFN5_03455, partial [Streptomonospora salina]
PPACAARTRPEPDGAAESRTSEDTPAPRDAPPPTSGPVSAEGLAGWLQGHGYEPVPVVADGGAGPADGPPHPTADPPQGGAADAAAPAADPALRLRNCPFDAVARSHPPVACGMNLELLRGLLRGAGADAFRADMAPAAEGCCVMISSSGNSKTNSR